jgi:endonuclease YncB( thermonuclease family)
MKTLAPFYKCALKFPTKLWRAQVLEVADGDTLTVRIDFGWEDFGSGIKPIRFASMDTWESHGAFPPEHLALGKRAKELTARLCLNRWCYLLTAMDPEKFGRILGDPFPLQDDGTITDVAYELYAGGFQKTPSSYPYRGPTAGQRDIRRYLPEFGGGV